MRRSRLPTSCRYETRVTEGTAWTPSLLSGSRSLDRIRLCLVEAAYAMPRAVALWYTWLFGDYPRKMN